MKIRHIAIDGYGRLSQCKLEFHPGLQVILGPNEQGKSTLRGFIGDVLYGQKRSAQQRLYDESNELRCPWENPEAYGGRLTYQLDTGREIEVFRKFDRKHESVQVFDRTHARDITGDFDQLRNREPLFALSHLGLSKEVFLNAATITHLTLDDLGDANALDQIREKVLSLADSGEERTNTDSVLKRLKARIDVIGPSAARTRPLPVARARLAELNREYEAAGALQREVTELQERRRALAEELTALRGRRTGIEDALGVVEHVERAERLQEAEHLTTGINEATQQCFALSAVREFPLDQNPEVLRMATLASTAHVQLQRTRTEHDQLRDQIAEERRRLGDAAEAAGREIPEECDQLLADAGARIQRLRDRIDAAETGRAGSEARLRAAEAEFAALPDFSLLADDPVTWLNQLANAFKIAVRYRDDECGKRTRLHEQIARQRDTMTDTEQIFARRPEFPDLARDYVVNAKVREEQAGQLRSAAETLQVTVDEQGDRVLAFARLSALTLALTVGLLVVAFTTGNPGVYVPAAPAGLAAIYFLASALHARVKVRQAAKQLEESQAKLQQVWAVDTEQSKTIDQMIVDSGCQTLRELEGKFDQYRQARHELDTLEEASVRQDATAQEAAQRVEQMFASYHKTLGGMGEVLNTESDVEPAAGRAIARYQSFRDAKRRVADNKEQIRRHDADLAQLGDELRAALEEERLLALEIRRMMRENGYADERKQDSALTALRSYRIRNAQLREKRGRLGARQETLDDLDRRVAEEEEELDRHKAGLSRMLAAGRCESVDQWRERAEQARRYQHLREQIATRQNQLHAVLRGTDLNALRAAVAAQGAVSESPGASGDALKQELEEVSETIDARMKEEHALQLAITSRTAGTRSLSEIEEERTLTEEQAGALDFELEAASYAMALIEDIARDKYARIAPRLASVARGFLKTITGGAYEELMVSRELRISVRIPQTQQMTDAPESVLSKGTVDQIYLALRLAMVQCLSETGETIPMLLDDPFANYDDQRLQYTLELLSRLAEKNQVLLFTCREDVARAAQTVGAPILSL